MKLFNVNPLADVYAQALKIGALFAFTLFMFWNYVYTKNAYGFQGELTSYYYAVLMIYIGLMTVHFTLNLITVLRLSLKVRKSMKR